MRCEQCGKKVKPVLALDVDGTLADYHGHFIQFARMWLHQDLEHFPTRYDGSLELYDYLGISQDTYRTIKLAYRQGGQKRFQPPLGDVRNFVHNLAMMEVEVWIATTRPWQRYDSTDPDTRDWLDHHLGVGAWHGIIYGEDKYHQLYDIVGERIITAIDDLPDQCEQAWSLGIRTWQRRSPYNAGALWTSGFDNWNEALIYVLQEATLWRRHRT